MIKIKTILIILFTMYMSQINAQHIIPKSIKQEVDKALTYYSELQDSNLEFRFKKNIKKSTMQARPTIGSFFRKRTNRNYVILISETFKISDKHFSTRDIPSDIFTGWIGHELGHIMDYQNRSKLDLIWFGVKYIFSENHIVEAERAADSYAVKHGMAEYILKTKDFILNHADISEAYKNRIKRYYLSPEEIMELVSSQNSTLKTN